MPKVPAIWICWIRIGIVRIAVAATTSAWNQDDGYCSGDLRWRQTPARLSQADQRKRSPVKISSAESRGALSLRAAKTFALISPNNFHIFRDDVTLRQTEPCGTPRTTA